MLKLRLKRTGRKSSPFYRLVIMENKTRRDFNGRENLRKCYPKDEKRWTFQPKHEKIEGRGRQNKRKGLKKSRINDHTVGWHHS